MGHILRLADEYKVEGVHDFCSKALRDLHKSKDNAVKVFFLSTQTVMAREDDRLESARLQCKTIVKDMDLVDIQGSGVFKSLNKEACESLLVERIGRLETHMTQVYPQFVGLAEYCLYLGLKCSLPGLVECPEHFIDQKVNTALPERIVNCSHCKKMIDQLVQLSLEFEGHEHVYGGDHHFGYDLMSIVKNFTTVMQSLQRKTSIGAAQTLGIAGSALFEPKTHAATPLCESKASAETLMVDSVGVQTTAATPCFEVPSAYTFGSSKGFESGGSFSRGANVISVQSPTFGQSFGTSGLTSSAGTVLRGSAFGSLKQATVSRKKK